MTFFDEMGWLLPLPDDVLQNFRNGEIDEPGLRRLAGYRITDRQASKIAKGFENRDAIPFATPLRVAILTDCNLEFCQDLLFAAGLRYGLWLEFVIVEYSDVMSQALDPQSALYRFEPNFIIHAGFGALVQSVVASFPQEGSGLATSAVERLLSELTATADSIARNTQAQQFVQTMPAIHADVFGNIEAQQPGALGFEVRRYNAAVRELGLPVIDVERLANRIGTSRWFNDGKYHWAKLPFELQWAEHYCDGLVRRLSLSAGRGKKCLVLDLDNTLWGGVIGDDGLDGIVLGNNSPVGEAFLAGQRYYKMLANRGVVLAVCSKNDEANARLPFAQHPDMILRADDIACFVANWQDKPSNLKHISQALNLGLDSFVFLDDNPMERDFVRRELPQVAVPEVPSHDASLYPRVLEAAGFFETAAFTSADVSRVADYKANAQRAIIRQTTTDLDSYLLELEMQFAFERFSPIHEARIVQLINRSNQFNLTTKRYTATEVATLYNGSDRIGLTVRLADKFTDIGLIAILIVEEVEIAGRPAWEIDTWLMSCRVLGRKVEQGTLFQLAQSASKSGIDLLVGRYCPTAKNGMVRDHYAGLGFAAINSGECGANSAGDGGTVWQLDVSQFLASQANAKQLPFNFSNSFVR